MAYELKTFYFPSSILQSNVFPCSWMKKVKIYFASRIDIISSNGSFQMQNRVWVL